MTNCVLLLGQRNWRFVVRPSGVRPFLTCDEEQLGSEPHGYSTVLSVPDKAISARMYHALMQGPVFVMLLFNM